MKITKEIIELTAKLASIEISPDEVERYKKEFSDILNYIEKLNTMDTAKVKPWVETQNDSTPLRKDEISESINKDKALGNRPEKSEPNFTVPKFIE